MADAVALPLCDLVLEGRLDQEMILEMREYVGQVIEHRPVMVLVDVSAVVQVTASGVVGILELRRLTRGRGGDVRLHGLSGAMTAAQTATRLTLVSRVYDTREEAVEAGSRPPVPVDRGLGRVQQRRGPGRDSRARARESRQDAYLARIGSRHAADPDTR